jgi:hypothetical protein
MAVLGRRSKSVTFRLSEQEFRTLMEACQTQGARCVSEAVRNVVFSLLGVDGLRNQGKTKSDAASGATVKLVQMQGRLEELDRELKRLTTALGRLQPEFRSEESEQTPATDAVRDSGLVQLTEAIS